MDSPKNEKMKTVNIVMTTKMMAILDAETVKNRSHAVRKVIATIMAAKADGVEGPLKEAIKFAMISSSSNRRLLRDNGETWEKSIIWIPVELSDAFTLESARNGLRVSDLIRGAMIGYCGVNPMAGLEDALMNKTR